MQEEVVTRDALLARDLDYVRGATPAVYFAYPSKALPRFLVPAGDAAGLRFTLRLLASEWGRVGLIVRTLISIPGVPVLLRTLLFERVIVEP